MILYDLLLEAYTLPHPLTTYARWEVDTDYEAIGRFYINGLGAWEGYIVFRNTKFSPIINLTGVQIRHFLPICPNEAVIRRKGEEHYRRLCKTFEDLKGV